MAPFVYDLVMNVRAEFAHWAAEDAVFHPSVEEQLKKYKDPKSARSFSSRAAGRAVAHIDAVISRASEQWEFYKQVRILNPTKLPDLDHDLKNLTALQFPIDDAEFRAEWHTYCRVENHSIDSPSALALFWANRGGDLAKRAYFLIHVPTTSASVERSFSLAGNMDTKYRHGLPNNTRRLTMMLMFNGDVEGRFKVA